MVDIAVAALLAALSASTAAIAASPAALAASVAALTVVRPIRARMGEDMMAYENLCRRYHKLNLASQELRCFGRDQMRWSK